MLVVGGLSLSIEDSAHSLKLIRCLTQATGSSSVLTNFCLLPPAMYDTDKRHHSGYTMSC